MTKQEAVEQVARVRGITDTYTLLIAKEATKPEVTERAIFRLMYDILLGVSYERKA